MPRACPGQGATKGVEASPIPRLPPAVRSEPDKATCSKKLGMFLGFVDGCKFVWFLVQRSFLKTARGRLLWALCNSAISLCSTTSVL